MLRRALPSRSEKTKEWCGAVSLFPTEEQQRQGLIYRVERAESELAVYKHLLAKAEVVVNACECTNAKVAIQDYRDTCMAVIKSVSNTDDILKAFTDSLSKFVAGGSRE